MNEKINRLHRLVVEAASNIPMYRAVYGENPSINTLADFEQLPITNIETFAQLGDVSKAVRNPWEMFTSFVPWNTDQLRFPLSVLHSKNDEKSLVDRLNWIMEFVGLQKNERIVFLVSPPYQYGAARSWLLY